MTDIKISIDISIADSTPPPTTPLQETNAMPTHQETKAWPTWCDPGHPLGASLIGLAAIAAAGILHLN